jgi:ribose 5-phosphate isomerase B
MNSMTPTRSLTTPASSPDDAGPLSLRMHADSPAVARTPAPRRPQSAEESGLIRRLVIACDHRGHAAKQQLLPKLQTLVDELEDGGCNAERACDYSDYAVPCARRVARGEADAAILLDGSGIGMGIAANKVRGIRAATCHDEITARVAREHNHCNVLCVGTDLVGERTLLRIVETFLQTRYSGGRHVRRVAKLDQVEAEEAAAAAAGMSAMRASS